jgi:hypothetical protein
MPRKKAADLDPSTTTLDNPPLGEAAEAAIPEPEPANGPSKDRPSEPASAAKRARKPKVAAEPVTTPSEPVQEETIAPAKPARRGAKSAPVAEISSPVVTEDLKPEEAPNAAPVLAPTLARSPRGKKATEATAPKAPRKSRQEQAVSLDPDEEMLVVLEWRPRGARVAAPAESEMDDRGGRRRRRRGRGRGDSEFSEGGGQEPREEGAFSFADEADLPVTFRSRKGEAKPASPAVAVVAAPVVPVRPSIPVPEDAPQVILRHGVPMLIKGHRAFPPLFFFGNPMDERRAKTVFEEMALAGEAGVHLHVLFLDLAVNESAVDAAASEAAYLLNATLKADPEAQLMFRVVFSPDRNWEQNFPSARYIGAEGQVCQPSICDDAFWGLAERCLAGFIKRVRLLPNAERIMGLHLDYAEWFSAATNGYDVSSAALRAFRDWVRLRYSNDEVTFRASWFDGRATFDTIAIPPFEPEGAEGEKFVRSSRKQRRYVDYHLFISDATMARIADLAYAVKEASEGNFLVGVSYGYTFEWSHPHNGHLALGKLLRTQEVDFIAGPPSYRNREAGGTAPFPGPIDSFALNGKLYVSEEDFKTSLSGGHEPDDFNPTIKTPQALDSVQWRGAGAGLAHAAGMCWMDLWGNGWLKTPSIWQRGTQVQKTLIERMASPFKDPDVVVFIDERALAYLVDPNAFTLLVQNVRESVLRSGLSAGFYLLSDLAHRETFPEAKLYIFLNAWDMRPELRSAIKNRLQRDDKVLFWLYAAGLFDGGRDSLERAREVTGIALKPQPFYSKSGTSVLNKRHPLCEAFPDRGLIGGVKLEPSYFAIPEGSTVLGEYTQTGLPSFVVKEFTGEGDPTQAWKSVFLGEPMVSPALIRALGQLAGAHIYDYQEDLVHVGPPFLTVHCHTAGPRTITLPPNWAAYSLQQRDFVGTEGNAIRFTAVDGSSHAFLVGPRAEIEGLLSTNPATVLEVEEIAVRTENVRQDNSLFDVPIMKLGDWIEGGLSDDAVEEWLLRPAIPEPEADSGNGNSDGDGDGSRSGRRRRRRRGGRGDRDEREDTARREDSGRRATVSVGPAGDDFEMNVTFRKRE